MGKTHSWHVSPTLSYASCNDLQTPLVTYSFVVHTEIYFRNPIELTLNQIVFVIFRFIWIQIDVRLLFQINRKMVNTIWFWVDLIGFRKYFSEVYRTYARKSLLSKTFAFQLLVICIPYQKTIKWRFHMYFDEDTKLSLLSFHFERWYHHWG